MCQSNQWLITISITNKDDNAHPKFMQYHMNVYWQILSPNWVYSISRSLKLAMTQVVTASCDNVVDHNASLAKSVNALFLPLYFTLLHVSHVTLFMTLICSFPVNPHIVYISMGLRFRFFIYRFKISDWTKNLWEFDKMIFMMINRERLKFLIECKRAGPIY